MMKPTSQTTRTTHRPSVAEWIAFWKRKRHHTPNIIRMKRFPHIQKIDGQTHISFRLYQSHPCNMPPVYSFRTYQKQHPLAQTASAHDQKDTRTTSTTPTTHETTPPSHNRWKEVISREGYVYYWDTVMNRTQYEKPAEAYDTFGNDGDWCSV